MFRFLLLMMSLLLVIGTGTACSSNEVGSGKASPKVNTDSDDGSSDDSIGFDDCDEDSGSSSSKDDGDDEEEEDESSDSLFLLQDPEFYGDGGIKEFLDDDCSTCHNGGAATELDTYTLAKERADDMLERMKLEDDDPEVMPPTGAVSSSKIEAFEAWIDGGHEEGEAPKEEEEEDEEEDEDEDDKTSSDPCGDNASSGGDSSGGDDDGSSDDSASDGEDQIPPGAFEAFIKPKGLEVCKEKNKVFDRELEECTLDLADIECKWDPIIGAFGGSQGIKDAKTQLESQGFMVDQCGRTEAGKLQVFLYCLAKEQGGACVEEAELEDSVWVQVRKVKSGG